MRILGIDYGSVRVGVALGDTESRIATPWHVIANEDAEETVDRIGELARQEGAERIVVGIPAPLGDQTRVTEQAEDIRAFIKRLERLGLPVDEENESLSSALADRQAREMGVKKKRDDLAAAAILQTYLDRMNHEP